MLVLLILPGCQNKPETSRPRLDFQALPELPDSIGVAGPIVGLSDQKLIVAGGANFGNPDDPDLWELPKRYLTDSWILHRSGDNDSFHWQEQSRFQLSQPVAYSSVVSLDQGVLVMGGENSEGPTNRAFLLTHRSKGSESTIVENDEGVPDLPLPCTNGGAAVVGDYVYLVAGQVRFTDGTRAASRLVWRLNLRELTSSLNQDVNHESTRWELVPPWPDDGPRRMHCLVTAQHDGFKDKLYVIGGRRFLDRSDPNDLSNLQPSADCWSFDPDKFHPASDHDDSGASETDPWQRLADAPVALTAGTAVPMGPAHILVPSGTSMDVFHEVVESGIDMRDFDHPGFPKAAYVYHTVTDTWAPFGSIPVNQVTTPAVRWGNEVILVSGEVRPRVRTRSVWKISIHDPARTFGPINMSVVVLYLLAMVGVGVWFARRNQSTDEYFRGGKNLPWWAAGCSIFATMLSSITYMAVPAKSFAQDWVYWVGNFMILGIAPIAVYFALPFFRRIDATSAYQYLELRFNRAARLIGSGSFSLFHVFRMGVVLALAALALASVTPMSASQCVIVMGLLSIVYCTIGGVEAVVWTDTLQTVILLGGALICLLIAWFGSETGSFDRAVAAGKFQLVTIDFSGSSFSQMALWVVILGGFGQNLASYTADQAVVQRYMTTPSQKLAARSIWLNGFMSIPASAIFFAMGTAFWMFYRSHPEKLDPSMASDRILPWFISHELPAGLAGLVVAGIFAAAQSTVSTSMNSGASTLVTDFFRPLRICRTERGYLWSARFVTLAMGTLGMITGLTFVDPNIKSLFDQFIGILGIFLGVLAGMFALGVTTRRASGVGSLIGAATAIILMITIVLAARDQVWLGIDFRSYYDAAGARIYLVNGYLYAMIGITVCYVVGYLASLIWPDLDRRPDLNGLTLWEPEGWRIGIGNQQVADHQRIS